MPTCLGCGKIMKELSREKVKQPGTNTNLNKVAFSCQSLSCQEKGVKKLFLMDGVMVIPVSK
jgi:hypothetical protein